jgi:hypothetical protein
VLHANGSGIVGQGGRTLEVSGPVEVTVDGLDGHDRTADNSLAVTDRDSDATLTNSVTRGPISNAGHLTLDRVNGIGTAVSTTGTTTIGRSSSSPSSPGRVRPPPWCAAR